MDVAATLTAAMLLAWGFVLACVAAGAVLYYWPADFEGRARRGFDVLPAPPPPHRQASRDVTAAR